MITLFRTRFRIRLLYKSGNSQEFWATKFKITKHDCSWTCCGSVIPLSIGLDELEAVFQIGNRVNWLRALRIVK